jgi:hypothetical protein
VTADLAATVIRSILELPDEAYARAQLRRVVDCTRFPDSDRRDDTTLLPAGQTLL